MLDYVRRFGRFSRKFLSEQVDRSHKPRFFDFCKYPNGRRPLPPILTNPHELWAWVRLLPKCSAKRYLVQRLLAEKIKNKEPNLLGESTRVERALSISERAAEEMIKLQKSSSKIRVPKATSVQSFIEAEKAVANADVSEEIFDLQCIPVHEFGHYTSSSLMVTAESQENTHSSELAQKHWWAHRKDRQFLYRGKKYRLTEEGWRRIYRPTFDFAKDRRLLMEMKRKEKMTKKKIIFKHLYRQVLAQS
jgi:hypothetical protein